MAQRSDPTILIPMDFSEASWVAMSFEVALTRALAAHIVLLHEFAYTARHRYSVPIEWMVRELREKAENRLELARLRALRADCDAEVLLRNNQGQPADEIIKVAGELPRPIIVLGTHSRSGLERFLIGSTAEKVLRHLSCPVITLGPHVTPFWYRDIQILMLATDLTERSLGPIPFLSSLWSSETRLIVLHVGSPDDAIEPKSWSDDIRGRLTGILGKTEVARQVEFKYLVHTDITKAIDEVASVERVDLLAIGVHPGKNLTACTQPRTAFQIIMSAPCPVATICQ